MAKKNEKPSREEFARNLVVKGKTNEEIFAILKKVYRLPERHKKFVTWTRWDCVRRGLVGKKFAREHAHEKKAA